MANIIYARGNTPALALIIITIKTRLKEIIHNAIYLKKWLATLQVYSFGSSINLFCQVRNERQNVLQRKLSHQYVGVPY